MSIWRGLAAQKRCFFASNFIHFSVFEPFIITLDVYRSLVYHQPLLDDFGAKSTTNKKVQHLSHCNIPFLFPQHIKWSSNGLGWSLQPPYIAVLLSPASDIQPNVQTSGFCIQIRFFPHMFQSLVSVYRFAASCPWGRSVAESKLRSQRWFPQILWASS